MKYTHNALTKINHLVSQGGKIVSENEKETKVEINLQVATIDVWGKVLWSTKTKR